MHRASGTWPRHILEALAICSGTFLSSPPGALPLDRWQWPVAILYGDAAISTRRMTAILYTPFSGSQSKARAFTIQVPADFLSGLSPTGDVDHSINGFDAYLGTASM